MCAPGADGSPMPPYARHKPTALHHKCLYVRSLLEVIHNLQLNAVKVASGAERLWYLETPSLHSTREEQCWGGSCDVQSLGA